MRSEARLTVFGMMCIFGVAACLGGAIGSLVSPQVLGAGVGWLYRGWFSGSGLPVWAAIWLQNLVACASIVICVLAARRLAPNLPWAPQLLVATVLATNGVIPGAMVGNLAARTGLGVWEFVWRGLLPHGALEVPAFLFACWLANVESESAPAAPVTFSSLVQELRGRLAWLMTVTAPVLLGAALIEETITRRLLAELVSRL